MPPDGEQPRSYVIVGASGGIGSCLARRLAADGARLTLAARSPDRLQALADEVGGRAVSLDATSFSNLDSLFEQAGDLDGAVNLAGSILLKPAHLTSESEFRETIDLNLTSAFGLVRSAGKAMRSRGGSIVLVSSCAASVGLSNHEAISAAKAGVEGLVRAAAATYAPQRIRVNAVAPGLVDTPMSSRLTSNEAALKASTAMHPLGRIGTPDDIARSIEWLLDPQSDWITGQVLGVDGGLARVRSRG